MIEQPLSSEQPLPGEDDGIVDGDAATHLEALGLSIVELPAVDVTEGIPLELVGQHLRLSGSVNIGHHSRLSDFVNHSEGLIELHDVTVLRRNGDPTRVVSHSLWVNPDEVTLIGEMSDVDEHDSEVLTHLDKHASKLIIVTPGHTLTGDVHLNPEAVLSYFIDSIDPQWIPMTDVRTRSLADRRVISSYGFALINRSHIVAATQFEPEMGTSRGVV